MPARGSEAAWRWWASKAFNKRARPVARRGVHHPTGALVDDHQMGILMDDHDGQRLGSKGQALGGWNQAQFNRLAGANLAGRHVDHSARNPDMARRDKVLQVAAREFRRYRDQDLVEPLAMQRGGNGGEALFGLLNDEAFRVVQALLAGRRLGGAAHGCDPILVARFCSHTGAGSMGLKRLKMLGGLQRRCASILTSFCAAALVAGCGSTPKDETAGWNLDKLYSEAKQEADNGAYDRAAKLFERLEGRAAGTILAQQAQLERAYVLHKSGEKAQSLAILERFVKLHPTSPALDYAYYLQGIVNFNDNLGIFGNLSQQKLSERDQQASRDSYQAFRQLVEQFPQSAYVPDARARMNFIVNSLADYEVHVARYYFRRGAYVAAANRAQQAVREFQQFARDRRSPEHPGAVVRPARPDPIAR